MEGSVNTPIEGLTGDELQGSFLLGLWEMRQTLDVVDQCRGLVPFSRREEISRRFLVQQLNLHRMADKISLELGIPVEY